MSKRGIFHAVVVMGASLGAQCGSTEAAPEATSPGEEVPRAPDDGEAAEGAPTTGTPADTVVPDETAAVEGDGDGDGEEGPPASDGTSPATDRAPVHAEETAAADPDPTAADTTMSAMASTRVRRPRTMRGEDTMRPRRCPPGSERDVPPCFFIL